MRAPDIQSLRQALRGGLRIKSDRWEFAARERDHRVVPARSFGTPGVGRDPIRARDENLSKRQARTMRNVVVTGGSRGLGLAIAKKLAESGYRAIAIARKSGAQLSDAMTEAERSDQGRIVFVSFD